MWNIKKAGILALILVVPALVFLWVRFGGQNHFVLPRYYALTDDATGKILTKKNGPNRPWWQPEVDTVFHQIPPFRLLSQDSIVVSEKLTKGKIYVADFFFSRCPTICPKLSSQLSRVQDMFIDYPNILIVSHSVDPEHDTPEVLRSYAKRYDAQKGKWFFLTGDKKEIYNLAIKGYKLPVQDDVELKNSQSVTHSEKLVLVDKDGVIRGYYDGTDKKEVDRLIVEIKVLMDIYKKQQ